MKHILFTLFLSLFVFNTNANAQSIENLDISVKINKQVTTLDVTVKMSINPAHKGDLKLVLNDSASGLEVVRKGAPLEYLFDKENKPNIYFDGGLITIASSDLIAGNVIDFKYTLDIPKIDYFITKGSSEGITKQNGFETGMYSAWLPTELSNGNFNYSINIHVPNGYRAIGNGNITSLGSNIWHIKSNSKQFDVPVIVSDIIENEIYELGEINVVVSHFGKAKSDVSKLAKDIKSILTLFNQRFGPLMKKGTMRFAFVPRKGVSYSRDGFAVINDTGFEIDKFQTIAHEIGHFWFSGADSSSWEDWLNESYAEYGALMAIQQKYGASEFIKKTQEFADVSAGSPPIFEVNRKSDISGLVLYRKGPVILEETRKKIGNKKFNLLIKSVINLELKTTKKLLESLSAILTESELDWFEEQLHL